MVILLLRVCRPIFGSGKAIALDSGFCVTEVITDLKSKGVYAEYLIKKWYYCPKGVPGHLIDTNFKDKEVGYVGMIHTRTKNKKLL